MRTIPSRPTLPPTGTRPAAPSRRAGRADMSMGGFIGLVAGWSGALGLVLATAALVRLAI